jgi:DNA-binding response OmpR family regulator
VEGASLLVVEDDEAIGGSLVQALTGQGAAVAWARTAKDALNLAGLTTDMVLLDLGLPDADGLDLCRALRERYPRLDIIVVTARAEEIDVVVGLDAGADDYITKPFRLAELSARIRARLRRQREATVDSIDLGELHIDLAARRCAWRGEDIALRTREFDLLATLALDAGHVVTRRRLLAELWDTHFESTSKTLDVHISAVRRRLEEAGAPQVITTIRTVGYRLDSP